MIKLRDGHAERLGIKPGYKMIIRCEVARIGWETDNEILAIQTKEGKTLVVGSSHGTPYIMKGAEVWSILDDQKAWMEGIENLIKLGNIEDKV